MKIKGTLTERMRACVAMERAMAALYDTLAGRFPEEQELFGTLAREEAAHEKVIVVADEYGMVGDSEGLYTPPSMELTYKTVRLAEEARARFAVSAALTVSDALRTALELEGSMAENFVTELLAEDGAAVDTMFGRVYLDEREHIDRIRAAMLKRDAAHEC